MSVKAADFFKVWKDVVRSENFGVRLEKEWGHGKDFAKLVHGDSNAVLPAVARGLELTSALAYNGLDCVMYGKDELVSARPLFATVLSSISVAVEHEVECGHGLHVEVARLLVTEAPLRVLVTYPPAAREVELLDFVFGVLNECRNEKRVSDEGSFLLLLGHAKGKNWEGFVYRSKGWEKLG